MHFKTYRLFKIAPSKNTFQNIVARCLVTYNFLKGVFKFAKKNFKKINSKDRQRLELYTFLKNYQKIFHNYIKIFFHPASIKTNLCFDINIIILSLDEIRLIAQNRNIRDYENKSEENLIKAFSQIKPKIRINRKKLEEIRKDFIELRHKFFKKEVDKYRKALYNIKNYRHLSTSEIEETKKNLIELRKSLRFKKFYCDVDSVDYDDLEIYDNHFADDDEYRRIGSIRRLFKNDYYKPIKTDDGCASRRNKYIEYTTRGDR